jgi:hypothetical protein
MRYMTVRPHDVEHTHSHVLDTRTNKTLCGVTYRTAAADDDESARATCPTCARRDPREPQGPNDGPRSLKHLFQF